MNFKRKKKINLKDILDANSWHLVLKALQNSQKVVDTFMKDLEKNSTKKLTDKDIIFNADLQILSAGLYSLFDSSEKYSDEHLLLLFDALNQITLELIEKISLSKNFDKNLFALTKLVKIFTLNLKRMPIFWDFVIAHFLVITNSKNEFLRKNSVKCLENCINSAFLFCVKNKDNDTFSENERFNNKNFHKNLFSPWLEICKRKYYLDSTEIIITNLLKMIQDNGHEIIGQGWEIILDILEIISNESHQNFTLDAFKCLEMLIGQYLNELPSKKLSLIFVILENFKKILRNFKFFFLGIKLFLFK